MRASTTTTLVLSLVAAVAGMSIPVPVNPPYPASEVVPRSNGLPIDPKHVDPKHVNPNHVKAPKAAVKGRLPRAAGLPVRPQDMAPQPVKGVLPRSLSLSSIKNSVDPGCDENNVGESGFSVAGIHIAGSGSNHQTSPVNFDPATRNGNSNGLAVAAGLNTGSRNGLNAGNRNGHSNDGLRAGGLDVGAGLLAGGRTGVNTGNRDGPNAGNRNIGLNTNGLNIGAGIIAGNRNDPNTGTRTGLNRNGLAAGVGVGTGNSNGLAVGAGLAIGRTYSNGRQNNYNATQHSNGGSTGIKASVGEFSYGGNNGNNGVKAIVKAATGISSALSSDPDCDTPEGSAGAAGILSAVLGTSSNGPCESCEGGVAAGIASGLVAGVGL